MSRTAHVAPPQKNPWPHDAQGQEPNHTSQRPEDYLVRPADQYEPVKYPAMRYHPEAGQRIVNSEEEDRELGKDWFDSPAKAGGKPEEWYGDENRPVPNRAPGADAIPPEYKEGDVAAAGSQDSKGPVAPPKSKDATDTQKGKEDVRSAARKK